MAESKENPLGTRPLPELLRQFAIPSIVAMLVSSLYNIVDQIFIGQGIGYLGNAATNVAYPLTTICLAVALLLGVGSGACYSLKLGQGRPEEAARIAGNAITMMTVSGVLYLVLIQIFLRPMLMSFGATAEVFPFAESYTRITACGMPLLILTNGISKLAMADGSPRYSMLCMVAGAVVNCVLDPLCIFVWDMGIAGAAWATVTGQLISLLLAVGYCPRFKHIRLERRHFLPHRGTCLHIASLGMSSSINQIAITFVQIVLNNSLTYYGGFSVYGQEIPLAVNGIVTKVNGLLMAVLIGISQGSQPIIGFNYGAKQYARVRGIYRLSTKVNLLVSVAAFALFQLIPGPIVSLFGDSDNALYMEFAVKFMRIFLLMAAVNCVQMLSSTFFSAIGKPLKGTFLSLTRQVLFLVPLLLTLPLFFGIDGILFAAPTADFAAFLVSVLMVRHEMKLIRRLEAA